MMKIGAIKDLDMNQRMVFSLTGCALDGCESRYKNYNYGVERELDDLVKYIKDRRLWLKGISLGGADPLYQLNELTEFLEIIRKDPEIKNINITIITHHPFDAVPDRIKRLADTIIEGTGQRHEKIQSKYYEKREGLL